MKGLGPKLETTGAWSANIASNLSPGAGLSSRNLSSYAGGKVERGLEHSPWRTLIMEKPPDFDAFFRLMRDAAIACLLILLFCALLLWVLS